MSRHHFKFTQGEDQFNQQVELDGQNISSAVRLFRYEAQAGNVPIITLECFALKGTDIPAAVCEVTLIDTIEMLNLRQYLAESCDLNEYLLSLMSDEQIAEVLKTRDTARQIRLWRVHAEGPDADTSLRTYREKVRMANFAEDGIKRDPNPSPSRLPGGINQPEDLDE